MVHDMKIENINITQTLERARKMLVEAKDVPPSIKIMMELLIMIIGLFIERATKNSSNSSIPPSADPNRTKGKKNDEDQKSDKEETTGADETKKAPKKKKGGQVGHEGTTLTSVENPDEIIVLKIDPSLLPEGVELKEVGHEARQVVKLEFKRLVVEYRAQILEDEEKNQYKAEFPSFLVQSIQYGASVKAHSVYMSVSQLIPYARIQDYFTNEVKIPLSTGTIYNFNKEAYNLLQKLGFDKIAKEHLIASECIHVDETGTNINSKKHWIHTASDGFWTHLVPHKNRGRIAIEEIGIIPNFKGFLVHDHYKPYYTYEKCTHVLCNAHHLRELQGVIDNHSHVWAKEMQDFLCEINTAVEKAGGFVNKERGDEFRKKFREILIKGDGESPRILGDPLIKKRGRVPQPKHRNLLERLREYEDDTLRFMETACAPFTNNLGERNLRMQKVQQKISGCFRSTEGAIMFCLNRSYLMTCLNHGITATEALEILFNGKLPDFCYVPVKVMEESKETMIVEKTEENNEVQAETEVALAA